MSDNTGAANIAAAMEAFKTGGDVELAAYGSVAEPTESSQPEEVEQSGPDTLDGWLAGKEEQAEAESEEEGQEAESSDEEEHVTSDEDSQTDDLPDFEVIKAGGKKIKVDYTDREKIKRAHQLAAGMRKFQKERDEAMARESEKEAKLNEYTELFSKIEDAASREDFNELMKIMTAGRMDFDTVLQQRLEKERLRAEASEEELTEMNLKDEIAALNKRIAKQEAESLSRAEKAAKDREEAELRTTESHIFPAFDRYRFAGKLGDANKEHRIDQMIFNTAKANFQKHMDETGEFPSKEMIEKEFKEQAEVIQQIVAREADKTVSNTTKERKQKAKKTAQLQQTGNYASNDLKKDAADKIRSGNLSDLFKSWDKYGSLFK